MKVLTRVVLAEMSVGAVLFAAAGRMDLPWFWAVLAVHATAMAAGLSAIDPDLLRERVKPGPGARGPNMRIVALPMILAHLVVAGLDVGRFGWTGPLPAGVQAGALVSYAAGLALAFWAVRTNRFFSSVVRIQTDRGHEVVSSGPYARLRHPGYTGVMVATLSGGVALGSLWSLVPLAPLLALFLWRTLIEDRMLRLELPGYADYARRVRTRLIPGLW